MRSVDSIAPVVMPVVWTARHRGHAPNGGYWLGARIAGDEEPERGDTLAEQLRGAGIELTEPDVHGLDPILAVHDATFVDFLGRAWPAWVAEGHLEEPGQREVVPYLFATAPFSARHRKDRRPATIRAEVGLYAMDTMSLISEGTYDAAVAASDCALTAADLVADGAPAAYAAVRPPGHHAGPAFFGGSCYLNNAAIAAQRLLDVAPAVRRVVIVDIDAHQGNGTQEIFYERGDVFYASVHVDPAAGWFPHLVGHADETGDGVGADCNRNAVVAPGAGDTEWLAALDGLLEPVRTFDADALVVSLGVDAAADDPESPLEITADGYRAAGERLGALGLPTVLVQEGGYHLPTLGALVLSVLTGFEA